MGIPLKATPPTIPAKNPHPATGESGCVLGPEGGVRDSALPLEQYFEAQQVRSVASEPHHFGGRWARLADPVDVWKLLSSVVCFPCTPHTQYTRARLAFLLRILITRPVLLLGCLRSPSAPCGARDAQSHCLRLLGRSTQGFRILHTLLPPTTLFSPPTRGDLGSRFGAATVHVSPAS